MVQQGGGGQPVYLTTKEVAELLRVKERKVYDLAAADEIPHRRITGKLLFPTAEIVAWIEGRPLNASEERPAVLTGSHDPLLDWAVRELGSDLAIMLNGSLAGLDTFADGKAALAGMHVPGPEGWNISAVEARNLQGCVLIGWAKRARGVLLSPELAGKVSRLEDLKGKRIALRQPGAGAAVLFEKLLAETGLAPGDFELSEGFARTESEAATAVAGGEADAALGIEAMAAPYHLSFLPLIEERFDLLIDRRSYFTTPVQKLLAFAHSPAFRKKAETMGGYDVTELGGVRWLSP
ncbi:helix-turn-helix transcriptional regulator [Pseudoruegeria sp. HB172150]|uniref:helix-turn-helix transcriptional regulator n=1 Tax=Pseudoruegeria sp. HB172150 TaxID=2721164 RepID=UPI001551EC85|nr:helix-turn-helix transcriptional regulator [Pseudoruegeria sp. HB172150]